MKKSVDKKFYTRKGAPFKKKHAQDIGFFIEKIQMKTTKNILKEITATPNHIIHSYIEWDDSIAGHKYRLQQVRNIVNHIEIVIKQNGDSTQVRAFFSIKEPVDDSVSDYYVSIDVAFSDDYKRSQIISRAKSELKNWRDRYNIYRELKDVVNAIDPFLNEKD